MKSFIFYNLAPQNTYKPQAQQQKPKQNKGVVENR